MKKTVLLFLALILFLSCSSDKSNTQINILFGEWKLTSFVNEQNDIIITESDFENSNAITISFNEDFSYVGNTILNGFFGEYTLNNSKTVLVLLDVFSTEVGETSWGNLFFDSLNLNYNQSTTNWNNNYEIIDDALIIYYSEFEYMKFERI